jgi:vitamin B12 transporter
MRTFAFSIIPNHTLSRAILTALTLFPAAAHAGEAGPGDDIIVTATRSDQRLSDSGKSIAVINVTLIEQRQTVSVADLLRTTAGVTLVRNGGPGTFTSIFIRGAQSEQTVALIDGVKINDPSSPAGGFNFADLLTDTIERIEILRGPQSVLWGSQAIGGVVNLVTREPSEVPQLRATGAYGSHDEGHLTATVTGTSGRVKYSANAGYLRTDGISAFDRRLGGTERDGFRLFGANARAEVTLSEAVSLDLRGFYTRSKVDMDGFALPSFAFGDTREYARQEQIVGYAGINGALFEGAFRNRVAVNYALVDRDSYDPAQTPSRTLRGRGRNVRVEYQGVADLAAWARATFGVEHQQEYYRTFDGFSGRQTERANTDSVYADAHFKPLEGLNLGTGIRYDNHSGFGHATTISADISYSPNGGATRVKGSYGEGFKAPSLYQLFGDFGDPGLVPEKAKGLDIGIVQMLIGGRIALGATWFTRKVRDQIDFDLGTFTYKNLAAVRARGFEIEATRRPVGGLTIDANYTRTRSTNRQTTDPNFGNDLARRPRDSFNLSVDYRWACGLETGATLSHVSHSFDDAGNVRRLEGYTLVDLRAAYPVSTNIMVFGRIENLFDERYQTAFQFGQERRTLHAGVRLTY